MLKRLSSASLRGALLFFLSASVCVGANDADPPVNIFPSQTAATMILETMPPELRETVSKPSPQASHEANVVKAPEPEPGPPFEWGGSFCCAVAAGHYPMSSVRDNQLLAVSG